jgi:hypothetical protein
MSEWNLFLVPEDEPRPSQRGVGDQVLRYLEDSGIVEGFYDEDLGWHAAGPNCARLFTNPDADGPAFEYAVIYDRPAAHFVPDSHTAGFGARCGSCGADLDEALYRFLEKQGEGADAQDVADLAIACSSCGRATPVSSVKAEIDTAVTRFYLNVCVVDSFELSPTVMRDLERIVGSPLRVIRERL